MFTVFSPNFLPASGRRYCCTTRSYTLSLSLVQPDHFASEQICLLGRQLKKPVVLLECSLTTFSALYVHPSSPIFLYPHNWPPCTYTFELLFRPRRRLVGESRLAERRRARARCLYIYAFASFLASSRVSSAPHAVRLSSTWRLKSVMTSAGFPAPKRAVPATMTFEPISGENDRIREGDRISISAEEEEKVATTKEYGHAPARAQQPTVPGPTPPST